MALKPKVAEVIRHRIPDWVAEKEQFLNFIQYYYDWLEQKGKPLEFLRNIVEYTDIDSTDDKFVDLIINKILTFVPIDVVIDRALLVKNVKAFIKAKGTDESLNFIMKAIFDEEAYRVDMSNHVLRTSDNQYLNDGFIAIQVDAAIHNEFNECIGSKLVQPSTNASVKIKDVSWHGLQDGRMFWIVEFDPRFKNGEFAIDAPIKAMKSSSDPTFTEITEYQTVTSVSSDSVRFISDKSIVFYEEMMVMNLDRTFIAEYDNTIQHFETNNIYDYDIRLKNAVGTLAPNETIYFLSPAEVNTHLNLLNYAHGRVGTLVNDVEVINVGSGYYAGMPVSFSGGSGAGVEARVGNVLSGGVDDIVILNGGTGYRVGDAITIGDTSSGGYGFEAHVADTDGTGAKLKPTMEIDSVVINDGGSGYQVGDRFTPIGLTNNLPTPVVLTVASVATETTPTLDKFKIYNSGRNYSTRRPVLIESADVSIVDNKLTIVSAISTISGLVAETFSFSNLDPTNATINVSPLNYADSIVDVKVTTAPTPNINLVSAVLAYNGFGAILTPVIAGGVITGVTITNGGYNYVTPVVTISSSTGRGAIIKATKDSNGVITSVTVVSGGSNYTTASLTVSDAAGEGFIAKAINSTSVSGAITGITVTTNNEFDDLPSYSEDISFTTVTASGVGAHLSLLYKIKSVAVEQTGHDYVTGPFVVTSVGGVGSALSLLPVIEDNQLQNVVIQNSGYDFTAGCNISFDNRKSVTWSHDASSIIIINLTDHGFFVGAQMYIAFSGGPTSGYYEVHSIINPNSFKVDLGAPTSGSSTAIIGGYGATANIKVSSGAVTEIDFTSSGTGYTVDTFFYVVNSDPTLATQYPADIEVASVGDGSISYCDIVNPGYGYSTVSGATRVVVDGSFTTPAALIPTVFTGVDIITVESLGGVAFTVNLAQPWQQVKDNMGVVQTVLYQSANIGDTGFGVNGVFSYYVTLQGKLALHTDGTPWIWISNHGSAYDAPSVSIGTGPNKPTIRLGSSRKISKITIDAAGSGYSHFASAHVIGTGQGAQLSLTFNGVGGISSATVLNTANTNKGYVTLPTLTVNDVSNVGKISDISIKSPGQGFWKFPKLNCEYFRINESGALVGPDIVRTTPAFGARLLAVSESIGGVQELDFTSFGYGYEELPSVAYPVVAVMNSVRGFRINEEVSHTGVGTSYIGTYFEKMTIDANSVAIIHLTVLPKTLSINAGQTISLVDDGYIFSDNIKGRTYTVVATNEYDMTVTVEYTSSLIEGEYFPDITIADTDISVSIKAAKIIGIDESRNTLHLCNVDDVFGYSEEFSFIAESDGSVPDSEGRNFDGYALTTESKSNISAAETLIGHKSNTVAQILWMNRANSLVKSGAIGLGKKHFTSKRGLLNEANMSMINSKEIQDFSYRVHTGLSPNLYSSMLKNTVHPAGYYLSGVVEDVTEILDQLKVQLPIAVSGRTQDNVYLTILAALGSLHFIKHLSNYADHDQYANRFESPNENVGFNQTAIEDYDLWKYPPLTVWHEKFESDQRDYTIWPSTTKSAELKYHTIKPASSYTQTASTLTVTAVGHGLKDGDSVQFLNATHYNDRGIFHATADIEYVENDMVFDIDYKYYKCILGYTTGISPTLPYTDATHWELCEGNLNDLVLRVTTSDPDIFACSMPYDFTFTDATAKYYQQLAYGHRTGTYARVDGVRFMTVTTSEPHGFIASMNSWIYIYITHSTEHQYIPSYCQVVDVISATEFTIDTHVLPFLSSIGTIYYWLPNEIPQRFRPQVTLNNVAYTSASSNLTVTGLPDTHTLEVGNMLYFNWGTGNYYVSIDSKTATSITVEDPGVVGALNISFTLNQADPAQPGYNSLFEHWY